jgi:hypothetical protein
MKYVLEIKIIFWQEYAITSGFDDIIEDSCFENIAERDPKLAPNATVITIDHHTVFFTLERFAAPKFWAINGAVAKDVAQEI